MSPVNDEPKPNRAADIHVLQTGRHGTSAVLDQQRVDDDEREAKLSRSKLEITDFEFVSCRKCQKGAHLEADEDSQRKKYLIARLFRKNERITD